MNEIRTVPIVEALQKAAHASGMKVIAAELNKAPSTLYAELNPYPDTSKAKLGLFDALEVMRITGDYTALDLILAELGFRRCALCAGHDKPTVAEELADDTQKLGGWAAVCMNPTVTEADIRLAAAALHRDIEETEQAKLESLHRQGAGQLS